MIYALGALYLCGGFLFISFALSASNNFWHSVYNMRESLNVFEFKAAKVAMRVHGLMCVAYLLSSSYLFCQLYTTVRGL